MAAAGGGFSRLRRLVREGTNVATLAAPGAHGGGAADNAAGLAPVSATAGVAPEAGAGPRSATGEVCELCAAPVPAEHRHLWERSRQTLLCICRGCAILFDRPEAGEGHYRLVPERVRALGDFALDDALWERFDLPVELAFFHRAGAAERIVVHYPGALGAVESGLGAAEWAELEACNPVLRELDPEVEALLVNRTAEPAQYWIVPLDICYALVGVIRRYWKGLGGGEVVWQEVAQFFEALRWRAE